MSMRGAILDLPSPRFDGTIWRLRFVESRFLSSVKNSNNVALTATINSDSCNLDQSRNLVTILFLGI